MEEQTIPPDLMDVLTKKFGKIASEIIRKFTQTLEASEPPGTIYHYTNDNGLKGILETGRLWLSDIRNLNDPSELHHGFSKAVDILKARTANGPFERKFAEKFASVSREGVQSVMHNFVCSFSSNGNDLGQWRSYADDGRGYALGFDAKVLMDAFVGIERSSAQDRGAFQVTYKDAELESICHEIIDGMFEFLSSLMGGNVSDMEMDGSIPNLCGLLAAHIINVAVYFKHEAYESEKEFRFMQFFSSDKPPQDMKQRFRSYELVRYIEFDWRSLQPPALKEIIVGPSVDQSKAARFARDCLAAFHDGDVYVKHSEIPYRGI